MRPRVTSQSCIATSSLERARPRTQHTLHCVAHDSDSGTPKLSQRSDTLGHADDGMATSRSPTTGDLYQLPTIALICDFPHSPNSTTPTLLTFRDVQTLFHEMGHAIHSILGRTSLQVVSGTRCPTDFAELPSVLMEYFAADPSVLGLFARHWETDAPLPYTMVQEARESQKRWQGLQTETQILYSLVDQAYHSPLAQDMPDSTSSTKVFFDVYDRYSSVREPRETTPQAFFGHLVEYGGTYYSYLFDRAIAGKLWREVFRSGRDGGCIDRDAGEEYKNEVLKWGGGRSGWACVSGVLKDERLKEGGKEAMEEVGRWVCTIDICVRFGHCIAPGLERQRAALHGVSSHGPMCILEYNEKPISQTFVSQRSLHSAKGQA